MHQGAKKGEARNPGGVGAGRRSGARNLITSAFLRDLNRAWKEHGERALNRLADEDPGTLVRVVASVLPKQLEGEDGAPLNAVVTVNFVKPDED